MSGCNTCGDGRQTTPCGKACREVKRRVLHLLGTKFLKVRSNTAPAGWTAQLRHSCVTACLLIELNLQRNSTHISVQARVLAGSHAEVSCHGVPNNLTATALLVAGSFMGQRLGVTRVLTKAKCVAGDLSAFGLKLLDEDPPLQRWAGMKHVVRADWLVFGPVDSRSWQADPVQRIVDSVLDALAFRAKRRRIDVPIGAGSLISDAVNNRIEDMRSALANGGQVLFGAPEPAPQKSVLHLVALCGALPSLDAILRVAVDDVDSKVVVARLMDALRGAICGGRLVAVRMALLELEARGASPGDTEVRKMVQLCRISAAKPPPMPAGLLVDAYGAPRYDDVALQLQYPRHKYWEEHVLPLLTARNLQALVDWLLEEQVPQCMLDRSVEVVVGTMPSGRPVSPELDEAITYMLMQLYIAGASPNHTWAPVVKPASVSGVGGSSSSSSTPSGDGSDGGCSGGRGGGSCAGASTGEASNRSHVSVLCVAVDADLFMVFDLLIKKRVDCSLLGHILHTTVYKIHGLSQAAFGASTSHYHGRDASTSVSPGGSNRNRRQRGQQYTCEAAKALLPSWRERVRALLQLCRGDRKVLGELLVAVDAHGNTAAALAVQLDCPEMLELLCEFGVNPWVKTAARVGSRLAGLVSTSLAFQAGYAGKVRCVALLLQLAREERSGPAAAVAGSVVAERLEQLWRGAVGGAALPALILVLDGMGRSLSADELGRARNSCTDRIAAQPSRTPAYEEVRMLLHQRSENRVASGRLRDELRVALNSMDTAEVQAWLVGLAAEKLKDPVEAAALLQSAVEMVLEALGLGEPTQQAAAVSIVTALLDAGANTNHAWRYRWVGASFVPTVTPLLAALSARSAAVVRLLLTRGAEPCLQLPGGDSPAKHAIRLAARHDRHSPHFSTQLECVRALLLEGPEERLAALWEGKGCSGREALKMAAALDLLEVLEMVYGTSAACTDPGALAAATTADTEGALGECCYVAGLHGARRSLRFLLAYRDPHQAANGSAFLPRRALIGALVGVQAETAKLALEDARMSAAEMEELIPTWQRVAAGKKPYLYGVKRDGPEAASSRAGRFAGLHAVLERHLQRRRQLEGQAPAARERLAAGGGGGGGGGGSQGAAATGGQHRVALGDILNHTPIQQRRASAPLARDIKTMRKLQPRPKSASAAAVAAAGRVVVVDADSALQLLAGANGAHRQPVAEAGADGADSQPETVAEADGTDQPPAAGPGGDGGDHLPVVGLGQNEADQLPVAEAGAVEADQQPATEVEVDAADPQPEAEVGLDAADPQLEVEAGAGAAYPQPEAEVGLEGALQQPEVGAEAYGAGHPQAAGAGAYGMYQPPAAGAGAYGAGQPPAAGLVADGAEQPPETAGGMNGAHASPAAGAGASLSQAGGGGGDGGGGSGGGSGGGGGGGGASAQATQVSPLLLQMGAATGLQFALSPSTSDQEQTHIMEVRYTAKGVRSLLHFRTAADQSALTPSELAQQGFRLKLLQYVKRSPKALTDHLSQMWTFMLGMWCRSRPPVDAKNPLLHVALDLLPMLDSLRSGQAAGSNSSVKAMAEAMHAAVTQSSQAAVAVAVAHPSNVNAPLPLGTLCIAFQCRRGQTQKLLVVPAGAQLDLVRGLFALLMRQLLLTAEHAEQEASAGADRDHYIQRAVRRALAVSTLSFKARMPVQEGGDAGIWEDVSEAAAT